MKTSSIIILVILQLFFANFDSAAQVISTIIPNSSTPGKTLDVVVRGSGTHFKSGLSKAEVGADITVQKVVVQNEETALITIVINNNATIGYRTFAILTGSEAVTQQNAFEVFSSASFRASVEVVPSETLTLADLDPSTPDQSTPFFFISLYNDNISRKVSVELSVSASKRGLLGKIIKDPFAVIANALVHLSKKDFNRFQAEPGGTDFFKEVRALGTFPPDDYSYHLEVKDEQGIIIGTHDIITTVLNKTYKPELIQPGADFSQSVQPVYAAFPLFQWFSQNDLFDFSLYKVTAGQSPEEVVRSLPVYKQADVKGNSLLYPVSAEKLIEGAEYAWQVKGKITSSKGVELLASEVYRFVYQSAISAGRVAKIIITPADIQLSAGQQFQFKAELLDNNNVPVTGITPSWQVSPNKGSVTQSGLFKAGVDNTTVAVLVKAGSVSEFATVTVKGNNILSNSEEWLIGNLIRQVFGLPQKN